MEEGKRNSESVWVLVTINTQLSVTFSFFHFTSFVLDGHVLLHVRDLFGFKQGDSSGRQVQHMESSRVYRRNTKPMVRENTIQNWRCSPVEIQCGE
ncbi:uncharacterized protein LOC106441589 isoform X2 [Brassica napus]|uniref:uncharacterized protein LOC106441589 isoform X2 n=1 Tax=Brassica napus TaxID=3708 RepID=UPI00207AEA1C|nr:uncharacterized protein LOC106441589 isoform X2 [Brassica napus]